MIRLLIFTLIRFIIASLAIYVVLMFIKKVGRFLQGNISSRTDRSQSMPAQPSPQKTEEYKDVQDARFEEVPKPKTTTNLDHHE
jgi:hypothetical protein